MSSTLSSQDLASNTTIGAEAQSWRRWLWTFLLVMACSTVLLYVAVVAIDPYGTGRFALTKSIEVASREPRYAKLALSRDGRFNGAIIGASSSLRLDPRTIGESTGWRVAQLSIIGIAPAEELAVARSFDRNHLSEPTLVIFALDPQWCRTTPLEENDNRAFPYWLYQGSDIEYLSRILFPDAVKSAFRKVAIWAGLSRAGQRSDGLEYRLPGWKQLDLDAYEPPESVPDDGGFPSMEGLVAHIARLPPEAVAVIMLSPPYVKTLPVPGSAADLRLQACKAHAQKLENERPNTVVVDLINENEITREPSYFFDQAHYTPVAAKLVEKAIIDAIRAKGLARP